MDVVSSRSRNPLVSLKHGAQNFIFHTVRMSAQRTVYETVIQYEVSKLGEKSTELARLSTVLKSALCSRQHYIKQSLSTQPALVISFSPCTGDVVLTVIDHTH